MIQPDSENSLSTWQSLLPTLALGCSLVVLLLLGARQITSYDLGYHLAFGETFFETGSVVDCAPFIYTLPALDTPQADRPEPGPGSWYDKEGRYRFTNSSWLSQLFIFGAWRLGGPVGLNLLQICIIAGLFAMLIMAMKKCRAPSFLIALALLLAGLIINSRLNVRPELFGYLCIMAQYMMLAPLTVHTGKPEPPSWSWTAAMVLVEIVCINFHSYFLLGLAITGAVLTEYLLHAFKTGVIDKDIPLFRAHKKVIARLGITMAGMVLGCFLNPWGWRLVLQPFQTLLYMKKYGIGGGLEDGKISHPWDNILELKSTISAHWPSRPSDYAIMIMLVLVATAVFIQFAGWLWKRQQHSVSRESAIPRPETLAIRWSHLFMMAGMLLVGLQIRRNIGIGSLIAIPSAMICISDSCRHLLAGRFEQTGQRLLVLANAAVLALSVFGGYLVASGHLYEKEALPTCFGFGLSNTILPTGASDWLNRHAPDARVWCDFQSSSTLHYFTRPHTEVPILTNTWAYPPEVMAANLDYVEAKAPFNLLADKYGIDAVVLRARWSQPLHLQLGADPQWKIVNVEGVNVLYLRANKKYAKLAARYELSSDNFDTDAFVVQELAKDPSFKRAVLSVSDTLHDAGELDLAIRIIETGIKYRKPDATVWKKLLNLYNDREAKRRESGDRRCIDDLRQMKILIEKILEQEPGNMELREQLQIINRISRLFNQ